jgi:2-oxoglutarate ferredoxin oxidoreductase subunit delta
MSFAWVDIKEDWCKACGLCLGACKLKLLQFTERFNDRGYHPVVLTEPEKCTGCTACALVCPDAVIEVYRGKTEKPQTKDAGDSGATTGRVGRRK